MTLKVIFSVTSSKRQSNMKKSPILISKRLNPTLILMKSFKLNKKKSSQKRMKFMSIWITRLNYLSSNLIIKVKNLYSRSAKQCQQFGNMENTHIKPEISLSKQERKKQLPLTKKILIRSKLNLTLQKRGLQQTNMSLCSLLSFSQEKRVKFIALLKILVIFQWSIKS